MSEPLLVARALSRSFATLPRGTVEALREVDLTIERGELVMLFGRSGSGKTTLLHLAAGLLRPTAGGVLLDGVDLAALADRELARLRCRRLGLVFQFPSLLPALGALENVELAASLDGRHGPEVRRRATALLTRVGLGERLDALPRELSAGEQKRVVIARALMNRPQLLLADEPTADLDEETEVEIMELLARLHRERGLTVLMATHARELARYATRTLEMDHGRLRAVG